jgi:hypothetical protein
LGHADIPVSRAQLSWIRELDRRSRISKSLARKTASEIGKCLSLAGRDARDDFEEILCILTRPNYTPGNAIDISFLCSFFRRVGDALGRSKCRPPMDEHLLVQCLTWINAVFSPAGMRHLIASATGAELTRARDGYFNWFETTVPSLMPLAQSLAPAIVPLLLPAKGLEPRLARLGAL